MIARGGIARFCGCAAPQWKLGWRPNTALELTPLRGLKIVAILVVGIGPTVLPI
jgi:hypothetical protein